MEEGIEKVPALRITEQERTDIEDTVVREFPLTIIFNNQELVTLLCSPSNLKQLAVGYLVSEGLIKEIESDSQICCYLPRTVSSLPDSPDLVSEVCHATV